jgi:hypothetical protein
MMATVFEASVSLCCGGDCGGGARFVGPEGMVSDSLGLDVGNGTILTEASSVPSFWGRG